MEITGPELQKIIGWEPHHRQNEILVSESRDIVICAGRRFGKSAVAAYIALRTLLEDNRKIWIVSPTYDLSLKVFDYLAQWYLKVIPSGGGHIHYRPTPMIETPWGSKLECKSAENPTGLLGEELDLLIVDEASRIQRNVWETYLFATTASRKGRSIFISTPFGKNWFYEQWLRVKPDGGSFHFTSMDGVSINQEEWERAQKNLPEQVFKQEYMALFLEDAASVFRGIMEIVKDKIYEDAIPSHTYVLGVDLAKVNDFTVLTMVDQFSHKVVAWERFNQLDYNLQKARIMALARRYGNAKIIIDSTGVGNPISEDIARAGFIVEDFKISNKSKQELIEKLSIFIDQRGIVIPNETVLIDELSSFGYEMTESGRWRYSAPSGKNDDCVISLALAVWGLQTPEKENENFLNFRKKKRSRSFDYG